MTAAGMSVVARMSLAAERAGMLPRHADELCRNLAMVDAADMNVGEVAASLHRRLTPGVAVPQSPERDEMVELLSTPGAIARIARAVVLAYAAATVEAVLEGIADGRAA
ncbi:MAG: hypothetical protein WKG00_14975 [Polyangiaceae bacterium]